MASQALTIGVQAVAIGSQLLIKNLKPDQSIHGLTALFALAVYSRSIADSRISIKLGKISIQPPGVWTNGVMRPFVNHDARQDLLNLCEPIDNVCKIWTLEEYPFLRPIYEAAKVGLERLEKLPKWDPDLLKPFHQVLVNVETALQSKEQTERLQKESIKESLVANKLLEGKEEAEIQKIVNDIFQASKKPKSEDQNIEKYKSVWSLERLKSAVIDFAENDTKVDEAIMLKLDVRERGFNAAIKSMTSINPT